MRSVSLRGVLGSLLGITCAACAASTTDDASTSDELQSTAPVRIRGDAELAKAATSGSGTASSPFVITGRRVKGHFSFATGVDLDACFSIANTTKPFVLKDSSCDLAHVGAKLQNVQNAKIEKLAVSRVVGVFGWASRDGRGEDGTGILIEDSSHVTLEAAKVSDVYGGFGTFGVPLGPDAQDGRAGGAAIGMRVARSSDVTISRARIDDMWGGAGGAGAVGIFAGDPNGVGGRGGLGGMAIGISLEGGSDLTIANSEITGVRAGAGAAAAVSNIFFFAGDGGDAGDGNMAAGVVATNGARVTVRDSAIRDVLGSAGGAGAVGGIGVVGGKGGRGGRGGSATGVLVRDTREVTLSKTTMRTIRGAAAGAGAAGVVGFVGGSGGAGGDGGWGLGAAFSGCESVTATDNRVDTVSGGAGAAGAAGAMAGSGAAGAGGDGGNGGWAVGLHFDRSKDVTCRDNEADVVLGAVGAAGGAGAVGAFFIEAQGGKGGDGGWSVGSSFFACERIAAERNAARGQIAGLGGLGGGIQLVTMGAPGASGRAEVSFKK